MKLLHQLKVRADHRGPHGHEHVYKQRSRSLFLLLTGVIRIIAWTLLGICVALGLTGVPGFHWATELSKSVPFVAMISIYANWATDVDASTAAYAALVAADAHGDSDAVRRETEK